MVTRKRVHMTSYVHCLSCYIFFSRSVTHDLGHVYYVCTKFDVPSSNTSFVIVIKNKAQENLRKGAMFLCYILKIITQVEYGQEISSPSGFEPRTVQPVLSRYTLAVNNCNHSLHDVKSIIVNSRNLRHVQLNLLSKNLKPTAIII
jgi:hypothetical protein